MITKIYCNLGGYGGYDQGYGGGGYDQGYGGGYNQPHHGGKILIFLLKKTLQFFRRVC